MRPIKYRAWHKQEKKMFRVRSLEWDLLGQKLNRVDGWYHGLMVLMQFTGLKDRDGVEIYEGDIIEDTRTDNRGHVLFDEGGFYTPEKLINFPERPYNYKVIGNIYEHPRLLEDTP